MQFTVAAFYKFVSKFQKPLPEIRTNLLDFMKEKNITGTILLAEEGINSTISGSSKSIQEFLTFLKNEYLEFSTINPKFSYSEIAPFKKTKVKIKKEILTFNETDCNPATTKTGTFVNPKEWNTLINDPEVKLLDVRNSYETKDGTFRGAIDPKTENFTDFKEYVSKELDPSKDKKIAMFCTGGIRCEKASSYMLNRGFKEVYQLDGGILKYLEETPQDQTMWEGKCFIFDDRESLDQDLHPSPHAEN